MNLIPGEPLAGIEVLDGGQNLILYAVQALKLALLQVHQKLADEAAYRGVFFRGSHARTAVDLVWK